MRHVEYITNGFGAPPQRAYAPDVLSSIRQALPGAPDSVINAATCQKKLNVASVAIHDVIRRKFVWLKKVKM